MSAHKGRKIEVNTPSDSEGPSDSEMNEEAAGKAAPDGAGTEASSGMSGTGTHDAETPAGPASTGSFSPKMTEPKMPESSASDEVDMDAEMDALLDEEEAKAGQDAKDKALADARQEAQDLKERYLRLQAEWDNFRKRNAAEREDEKIRANERIVKDLIPVVDDFERAIAHAEDADDIVALKEGVEAVHTKIMDVFSKSHVEVIDPEGEPFDANRHQAIGTTEDDSVYDETVTQVLQKGYEMGGHVIRPAMVMVSTGGKPRPVEEKQEDEQSEDTDKE